MQRREGGSEVYLPDDVSLIRSQNVYNDGFKRDGLAYIDDRHAKELQNVIVEDGDVLLNITGDSVARVCQAPNDVLPARVNQHVAIIRPRKDVLDSRYLRYFLVNSIMQQHMLALAAVGATRNALTKGMIEAFEVPTPPLSEQRAIAHILGTLDNKIELAKEMREAQRCGEDLGLSDDELAFYDALEVNDSAVKVLGDDALRTIARELVESVRRNVTIDWTLRESARAKLRTLVKRILRKYGYPPDKQEKATQTVLEQAELIAKDWAE